MHIVFFCHYFPPEGNAPASRTFEHCTRWVAAGNKVIVITCVPNVPNGEVYTGYKSSILPQRENIEGIEVIRVWTYLAQNAGNVKRIANYLSYMISAVTAFAFLCPRPDVVIATSPHFFCGWCGVLASWLKRTKLIIEIRDIWPESIVTVGAMRKGFAIRTLEWLERRMYICADHIITVGQGYRNNIVSKANVADRISVITNGVDCTRFQPQPKSAEFASEWGLNGKFVCAYVGTIGMAHGLETAIEAATILKSAGRVDIVFLLVGDGARRRQLEQLAKSKGVLELVKFTGLLPKDKIPVVLASSDCILVHLRKTELFETVIPSKIFETMAMERPLIMGVRGEAAEIVARSGCGLVIEPENAASLVDSLMKLYSDTALYQKLSKAARTFVLKNFSRDRLAQDLLGVIKNVVD